MVVYLVLDITSKLAFFDANGHARFTSPETQSKVIRTGWTGDVMIKELESSMTMLKVTKKRNSNKVESIVCSVTIPTLELIKKSYYRPSILTLSGDDSSTLMVQVSWFPIDVSELPQADLISNSGDLTITAKSAENLLPSDLNGFSDPYLKFYVNAEKGEPAWKTKTVKKTLNPTWNDTGTIQVGNRMYDTLVIRVMDWDSTSADDTIGWASLPLSQVDPKGTTSIDIQVDGENGEDGGILHLDFEFEPKYVTTVTKRETKVGDIASKGIGTGLKAGTTVIGAGLGTVGKLRHGIFGGKKKSHKSAEDSE